jgi:hypothetical protein
MTHHAGSLEADLVQPTKGEHACKHQTNQYDEHRNTHRMPDMLCMPAWQHGSAIH